MMILPVSNAFAPRRVEGQTLLTHRESLPGNAASFVFRYKAFYWQSRKVSTPGSEPAACRAHLRADRGRVVRRFYRQSGRKVHLLVHQTISTRSDNSSTISGSELPELSLKSLDLLGGPFRGLGVLVPDAGRLHPRRRQGGRRLADLGRHSLPVRQSGW
jgi:hypothetical protein